MIREHGMIIPQGSEKLCQQASLRDHKTRIAQPQISLNVLSPQAAAGVTSSSAHHYMTHTYSMQPNLSACKITLHKQLIRLKLTWAYMVRAFTTSVRCN